MTVKLYTKGDGFTHDTGQHEIESRHFAQESYPNGATHTTRLLERTYLPAR